MDADDRADSLGEAVSGLGRLSLALVEGVGRREAELDDGVVGVDRHRTRALEQRGQQLLPGVAKLIDARRATAPSRARGPRPASSVAESGNRAPLPMGPGVCGCSSCGGLPAAIVAGGDCRSSADPSRGNAGHAPTPVVEHRFDPLEALLSAWREGSTWGGRSEGGRPRSSSVAHRPRGPRQRRGDHVERRADAIRATRPAWSAGLGLVVGDREPSGNLARGADDEQLAQVVDEVAGELGDVAARGREPLGDLERGAPVARWRSRRRRR